jgi:hypothetical protein
MESAELPTKARYYKVAIPFSPKEEARFRAYLKASDKKAGAFTRTAILAAMAKEGGG